MDWSLSFLLLLLLLLLLVLQLLLILVLQAKKPLKNPNLKEVALRMQELLVHLKKCDSLFFLKYRKRQTSLFFRWPCRWRPAGACPAGGALPAAVRDTAVPSI